MKLKPSSYFLIVIMLVSLAVILGAMNYPNFQTKILPVIVGSIVFVLTVIALIKDIAESFEWKIETEEEEVALTKYRTAGAWVLVFAVACYLLGFFISIPVFIMSYLKLNGRKWFRAISVAVLTMIVIYLVFGLFLKVDLYPGLILSRIL